MPKNVQLISTPAKRGRYAMVAAPKRGRSRAPRYATSVPRSVRSNPAGFPKQLRLKMKYSQAVQMTTPSTQAPVVEQWSVNSCFDPYATGGGHKPMNWTQMTQIYNTYTVMASKFSVSIVPAPSNVPVVTGIYIEDDLTITPTSVSAMCEQPGAVFTMMNGYGGTRILSRRWNAKQAFGGDVRDDPNLSGSLTASPVTQQYYTLFVAGTSNSATIESYQVIIEYDVIWDNLIQQNQN